MDILANLAEVSVKNHYTRPVLTDDDELHIEEGRHPVIEQLLPPGQFVSNDVHLNTSDASLIILTGPNIPGGQSYFYAATGINLHNGSNWFFCTG